MFNGYRAVGLVADGESAAEVVGLSGKTFAAVGVGRVVHTYDLDKLRLVFVGAQHERRVRAVGSLPKLRWVTAAGAGLYVGQRSERVASVERAHGGVKLAHVFGMGSLVVSLGRDGSVAVWDMREVERPVRMGSQWGVGGDGFRARFVMHPLTYVNKVLFCGEGGAELWNLRSRKRVYAFRGLGDVRCAAQSPVVDVVAFGLDDGGIVVHNLRSDRTLVRLGLSAHEAEGGVTAVSFRSDGVAHLAASTARGGVVVFDLDRGERVGAFEAHEARIGTLRYLDREPLLVTAGSDNALRSWVFNQPDPAEATPLRARAGHFGDVARARFYNAHFLLSMGAEDRALRRTSTFTDVLNAELSQGHVARDARRLGVSQADLRLPEAVDFDSSSLREYDWDNVVSCHVGLAVVRLWSTHRLALSKTVLDAGAPVSAVCVSACGNFALVGLRDGRLLRFAMQSGLRRAELTGAHHAAVQAVVTDDLGQQCVSGALDGTLAFWSLGSPPRLVEALTFDSPIYRMRLHRGSGLLAVVHDDMMVRVVDIVTRRVVRQLTGAGARVVDLCFSPDARWLVLAGADSELRVWDLPTARMVDWMRVPKPFVSIDFSPLGDFLVSAHVGSPGLFLWSNCAYFGVASSRAVSAPRAAALPGTLGGETDEMQVEADESSTNVPDATETSPVPVHPLAPGLVTMSGVPQQTWLRLPRLAEIRERNRPEEPAKKPEAAPFFIPTNPVAAATDITVAVPDDVADAQPASKIIKLGGLRLRSQLAQLIGAADHDAAMAHLRALPAGAIDVELRSLDGDSDDLLDMINFFIHHVRSGQNFELIQAALQVFLRAYADDLASRSDVQHPLTSLAESIKVTWSRVVNNLETSSCLLNFCLLPTNSIGSLSGW